ncbi:MAG: hypothetical protein M3Z57_02410 [Candidatus Dormibacteraeota bacterium]|nr:hypothetical protein [Candidatus Dormibacteraeota bacterium]
MNAPSAATVISAPGVAQMRRGRLVRDRSVLDRFGLKPTEMYRVAYVVGGAQSRRVSRSLVVFEGVTERRRWDGEATSCLDFVLPQGRPLSLVASQIVDVRPAGLNERGQWVLLGQDRPRRRRRPSRQPVAA